MSQTVSISERLRTLERRPLFTVDGMTYSWGDALAWAAARGTLEELRQTVLRGMAALARAAGRPEAIVTEELSAAAVRFRYQRRLLSAEELDAWLRRWGLTVNEWGGYLERSLLLKQGVGDDDPPPDGTEIAEAEFVDAVCSGFLEREALGFAADTALANLTPVEAAGDRAVMIERTLGAAALARAGAVSESSLEREIARQGAGLDAARARRARASRAGGRKGGCALHPSSTVVRWPTSPRSVRGRCRALSVYLGDLEPSLQPSLLAAQPGELVGPVEERDGFVLLAVNEREPAAATDPELRRRAETLLVERAREAGDRGTGGVA